MQIEQKVMLMDIKYLRAIIIYRREGEEIGEGMKEIRQLLRRLDNKKSTLQ